MFADAAPAWVSYAALSVSLATLITSTSVAIYTWRRNGSVVTVRGDLRVIEFQGPTRRPVLTGEVGQELCVTARNWGRTEVVIHHVWIASKSRKKRSTFETVRDSPSVPVTVGALDRVHWFLTPTMLGVLAKQHGNPLKVRPLIEYGPGRWKSGRVMRIKVGERHLQGASPRFKSTAMYWLRTRLRRKGVGPFQEHALPIRVNVGP